MSLSIKEIIAASFLNKIIKETRSYGLMPQACRERLIDQIMSYLERYGPCDFIDAAVLIDSWQRRPHHVLMIRMIRGLVFLLLMPQMFVFFADMMRQQNELIRQVTQLVSLVQLNNSIP